MGHIQLDALTLDDLISSIADEASFAPMIAMEYLKEM
jgi:hypothetical protein